MKAWFDPEWEAQLREAGLGTADALVSFKNDHCVSTHNRGATWKIVLPGGELVFLKQDFYTALMPMLRRMVKFQPIETNTERECRLLRNAEQLGFRIPRIIAQIVHTPWTLPGKGAMVELALKGRAVHDIMWDETVPEEVKQEALAKARAVLDRIQDHNLDWRRDCKPEHFFLCDDGEIALIDGERLFPASKALTPEYRAWQHQRFDSFLPEKYQLK